jgi:hypothetical protein
MWGCRISYFVLHCGVRCMYFGNLIFREGPIFKGDDIYSEEDTYPKEDDEYELWWARRRLRKHLSDHER